MPKVLIIDDDPDQTFLYTTKFKLEGFEVVSTLKGEAGPALAEQEKPDAVILDMIMNGCDGLEVLKELKKCLATKNIPVLLFTNLAKKDVADQALQAGAAGVLIKTDYLPKDLVEKVRQVIGRN